MAIAYYNGSNFFSSSTSDTGAVSTIRITGNRISGSVGCNESKKFDNDEKALYHGLKSAYRMSRPFDGKEYGTEDPPYESAARIAVNVAIAYLQATRQEFTSEASFDYVRHNFGSYRYAGATFAGLPTVFLCIREDELSDALDQAWTQIDDKRNHYDAARTALAASLAYLGKEFVSHEDRLNVQPQDTGDSRE